MSLFRISIVALSAIAVAPLFADEPGGSAPKSPFQQAAKNREYIAKFKDSFAVVRYWTKKNANGEEPRFRVPYKCPNCNNTHYKDSGVSCEKGIPAEFAGFVTASDRVLMTDVMIEPEFVDHIDVECAGETIRAVEFEASQKHRALVLKTERPFANAKAISFSDGTVPDNPVYFFIVRETGETVAGFSSSNVSEFRHIVELGKDIYKGNPNTLVLDANGNAVTVALQERMEIGQENFSSPSSWEMEGAEKRFERLASLEEQFRKAVLPVYLQLEAKGKDEGGRRSFRWSSDDEVKNDVDTLGIVVEGGKVIIPAKLGPSDTARLVKLEATLPDGTKATLEFTGSYAEEGGLEARFSGGTPSSVCPLALYGREAIEMWNDRLVMMSVANRGGRLDVSRGTCGLDELKRERGNVVVADFERLSGLERSSGDGWRDFVFTGDGKLVAVDFDNRHSERWSSGDAIQGARLAALVSAPKFDLENIPRKEEDRKRTPWLGVEVQAAGADIVREKKAAAYLRRSVDRAPLVTEVAPGSPADRLGIKVGDILISAKHPSGSKEEPLFADSDRYSSINWDEAFADDRFIELGSSGEITPWPNADGGVNGTLAEFGVGTEVVIAWVSDGVRKEGKVALDLAPVHFSNAPRSRNKELGMTVCDMTYEVRKYFKLDADAPGVVVAKVKAGGVAAVAGVRPLELIIDVNGEGVKSAKDFLDKTKGKKNLSFTVRRLTATRVVPIKM